MSMTGVISGVVTPNRSFLSRHHLLNSITLEYALLKFLGVLKYFKTVLTFFPSLFQELYELIDKITFYILCKYFLKRIRSS